MTRATPTHTHHRPQVRQAGRGVGTLPVVMLLLLGSSLVLLYANRAALQELRSAALLTRSAAAREAADAGLAWAQVRMNDGRPIANDCQPTGADPAASSSLSWREHLAGTPGGAAPQAGCRREAVNQWVCRCGGTQGSTFDAPADDAEYPAFVVRLVAGPRPGSWWLRSTGCAQARPACLAQHEHDASAAYQTLLTPWPLGRTAPTATLSALGPVVLEGGATVVNDAPNGPGLTVSSAGGISLGQDSRLVSAPGRTAVDTVRAPDARWLDASRTAPISAETFALGLFGLSAAGLAALPGVVRIACPPGGCRSSDLAPALQAGPRWLLVDGDLTVDAALRGGSSEHPLILQTRALRVRAAFDWTGWVHAAGPLDWVVNASGRLRGALTVAGEARVNGPHELRFDPLVLQRWRTQAAPLLPVPGTWRDLADEGS